MRKMISKYCPCLCLFLLGCTSSIFAANQTPNVSAISSANQLPFRVELELADFTLPNGVHSYVLGSYKNKWIILAGRTNGLHGFSNDNNDFPPSKQNTTVYVIDPINQTVISRSLLDPKSGLDQEQIDLLSLTSPQYYQSGHKLYMCGGYGVDTLTGQFSTKDALTSINIPGLMHWVTNAARGETAAQHLKHIFDPIFQVAGGYMTKISNNPTLLIFGQNFQGAYSVNSNGMYSEQIRRFHIIDDGETFLVYKKSPKPIDQDPNFRRRDLNVVPVIRNDQGKLKEELVAFSGVFTPSGGIWTVPVKIGSDGTTFMPKPSFDSTFKQGMNNYTCPTLGFFEKENKSMYTIIFGGISYGFFENGTFQTDAEIPFINQITTIRIDKKGHCEQFLMDEEYPVILSTQSHPGNRLLFGAGAQLIQLDDLPMFHNGVLKFDKIDHPTVVGYVVGGIQSTVPNTSSRLDSAASPYIFKVTLVPLKESGESS